MTSLYLPGIFVILSGSFISLLFPDKMKGAVTSLCIGAGAASISVFAFNVLMSGEPATFILNLSEPIGAVRITVDMLSAFFTLFIAIMSFTSSLYSIGYMKEYRDKGKTFAAHFFFLPVMVSSMLLVVAVQNVLAFLIIWEIMSLSSFFLLVFNNEKEETFKAGINYLVAMHVGVIFLISGFTILSINSGSQDFNSFKAVFTEHNELTNILFIIFFAGFGTKAGFVPFHTWLPRAHPAAPSHISGLMSGVMIKTGIYGILRIITLIPEPTFFMAYFILLISLFTGIFGIANALAQKNLKKILAYSSIENIGIIGIGIGAGLLGLAYNIESLTILGFSGALFHVVNHSIFKSLLFFAAGGVYKATHILNIEKMGGLIKSMKFSAVFFLFGALAISGLPPFNGFIGEFFIYWSMIQGIQGGTVPLIVAMIVSLAGLAFIGAMSLICFTNLFSIVFLGNPRSTFHSPVTEVTAAMKGAMIFQCVLIAAIGLAPVYAFKIILAAVGIFHGADPLTEPVFIFNTLGSLTTGILIFTVTSAGFILLRFLLLRNKNVSQFKTWDCGYQRGNSRMQYSSSSFTSPFLKLVKPLINVKEKIREPEGLFPGYASYKSSTEDIFEAWIINPAIKVIEKFLNLFRWIQNGNTQHYILYGLIFLILTTIWIMAASK